jgi:hypothetical protein
VPWCVMWLQATTLWCGYTCDCVRVSFIMVTLDFVRCKVPVGTRVLTGQTAGCCEPSLARRAATGLTFSSRWFTYTPDRGCFAPEEGGEIDLAIHQSPSVMAICERAAGWGLAVRRGGRMLSPF